MERPSALVVGESLVDVVVPTAGETTRAPGGSPMNVAVGLARLGVATTLMTQIGDDEHGRTILEHLRASGVSLAPGSVVSTSTSTATAHLDGHGAASYDFDLHWDLGPRTLPAGVGALHVGSVAAALRPGRTSVVDLVEQAVEAGVVVSFDPNARPSLTPDAEQAWRDAREVAGLSTVVKLSDEDLAFLRPGLTAEEVGRELLGGRTRLVVVTFGGSGAAAFAAGAAVEVHARPVGVVDTVGAGDSFMAALLAAVAEHGLDDLHETRLRRYVEAAHQAAAITVSRRGADPPRRHELLTGWPHLG